MRAVAYHLATGIVTLVGLGLAWPAAAARREVYPGGWSYFGDPRSVADGPRIFTGMIGVDRRVVVEQYDRRTGETLHLGLHRNHELDDHDNPSLALWRAHLYAFYSPHSGHYFPLDRHSEMRYRVSREPHDLHHGFGGEREVRTNSAGGLGFTYPNAVATRRRLWLFWRGGNWYPTFSSTPDGRHWARARTLVRGPAGQRPYAKYAAGPDGSIHMIFTEGHPSSFSTSLYYARYRSGRFYRADGHPFASLRDLPLRTRQLDVIYRYDPAAGRAWPHDVAVFSPSRPVVTYTLRLGGPNGADTYVYGHWDGTAWRSSPIVPAGHGYPTFHSGGITLDHEDPSRLVLSRRPGQYYEVELWRTPDRGLSWLPPLPVTQGSPHHTFRPVIPRGFSDPTRVIVLHVDGMPASFRNFRTVVMMDDVDLTAAAPVPPIAPP